MKKIFITLAVLAAAFTVDAQQAKSKEDILSAIESAKAASENPKKAANVATWTKLAQTYMDAYNAPFGNGIVGQSQTDVELIMAKTKKKGESDVTIGNETMHKTSYGTCDYYFNKSGQLAMINVTKPYVKNALDLALQAYVQASAADVKAKKTQDIAKGITAIGEKYADLAVTNYQLQNFAESSKAFEASFNAFGTAPVSKIDTTSLYNAGFTAMLAKDTDRATKLFKQCIGYGYYGTEGDVYAKLADFATSAGDTAAAKEYLEAGFTKFPGGQAILVGLINLYLTTGENTDRLFVLLDKAKVNDPTNASLYYVEGTIHEKLGEGEKAIESYRKSAEINPDYSYAYIGEALYYFKNADAIAEKAQNEMNDAKYNALIAEYEKSLKTGIPVMEKAFEVEKDPSMKRNIAAYLKNATFRFRTESAEAQAKYEKYNAAAAQ